MAAGYIIVTTRATLLANKAGLSAYHRDTDANYTLTVRTADGTGSGWAGADERDWGKIDAGAIAAHALDKARRSRDAVAVEPGRYTVVLEPQAVGDLVQLLNFFLDARQADEGRSPFTSASGGSKIGQKVADSSVTLFSDPADPQLLAAPFDNEGYPLTRQVWIDKGVLTNLSYTRFWAKKQNKPFSGIHNSIKLAGGSSTLDDMIKGTERGMLVTRLWYLRPVDPRTALFTGLTRDGTLPDRARRGHAPREELPVQRFTDLPAQQRRSHERAGAARRDRSGRRCRHARRQSSRLQLHEPVRCGVSRGR